MRQHVAEFLTERDGFKCNYESVYLLNGASEGIKTMLFVAMGHVPGMRTGVLTPLPQYPLYSAAISQLNAETVSTML